MQEAVPQGACSMAALISSDFKLDSLWLAKLEFVKQIIILQKQPVISGHVQESSK